MTDVLTLNIKDIDWPCDLSDSLKWSLIRLARYEYGSRGCPAQDQYAHERGVFYILKGCTASCFYITEPERTIGGIFGKGDWLGVNTLNENIQIIATFEEIESTEIIHFPESRILALAKKEPEVYKWLFNCSKRAHVIWLQAFLSFAHNNLLQLCYILLDIHSKMEDKSSCEMHITQQKLSAVVGCTRSKLNALLKKLEHKGLVKLSRNKILVTNIEGLEKQVSSMNLMVQDPRKITKADN
ncbi:Crp/Fnr family transcriptional regulator [Vibrio variabilis]|uniref:Crp/Fnr family transcriptional regulator n=1 Tax=Vibrio variabilis TaxID=990271 RepID=UPI000DDA721B|nr:Crp/Fnr family transcriptional regulator [Vibrio variabilis]